MAEVQFDFFDWLDKEVEPTQEELEYFLQGVDIPRFSSPPSELQDFADDYIPIRPKPRDYQQYAKKRIYEEWKAGNESTLLVLPTGTGKTIVTGEVIRDYAATFGMRADGNPPRTLYLAHRDYLLTQAQNEMASLGVEAAIEKAEQKARDSLFGDPLTVIASIQSMQDNAITENLTSWARDWADLIIIDEGHHALAKSYRDVIDYFQWRNLLLVTATDERLDGKNLGQIVKSKAWEYPMLDAIKAGWLCPIEIKWIKLDANLDGIRTTKLGEYNADDIAAIIKPDLEPICRAIADVIEDRKTIIYCPDVECSKIVARAMTKLGKQTVSLDGTSKHRESVIDAYKTDVFQCMSNCQLFDEGFNVPSVSCIVMLSPTNSIGRYKQRLGRGTRKKKKTDKYQNLLLVDFTWASRKHSLIKPAHIFVCEEIGVSRKWADTANSILEGPYCNDLEAAMTSAEEYLEQEEKKKREIEARVKPGHVKYTSYTFDPFDLKEGEIVETVEKEVRVDKPASDAQLAILRKNGYSDAELKGMTTASAGVQIKIIKWRAKKGYCTKKQRDLLVRLGVARQIAHAMPFEQAKQELTRLLGARR
jgi:superfamily II DNA or RNA helicase